jgi:hypothetical protein
LAYRLAQFEVRVVTRDSGTMIARALAQTGFSSEAGFGGYRPGQA